MRPRNRQNINTRRTSLGAIQPKRAALHDDTHELPPPSIAAQLQAARRGHSLSTVSVGGSVPPAQRVAESVAAPQSGGFEATGAATHNQTGLSDGLKAGVEALSGFSLDPVRVHYNSSRPAQLDALAFAQGTDIHVGPGQEQHLPHEAWHVVQQAQGRVQPTIQAKGVGINDNAGLEHEADAMGARAAELGRAVSSQSASPAQVQTLTAENTALQRVSGQQALPFQHTAAVQRQVATAPASARFSTGGQVVQRTLVEYSRQDTQLNAYLNALDTVVNQAAIWALNISNVPDNTSGYYDRWKNLALDSVGNDNTDPFIYAAYGYAVETRTTELLGTLASHLPPGWTVLTQVTAGSTRPDIVISDDTGSQVAWIDLTSAGSVGHIQGKVGTGWGSRPYVFEVTYPVLDTTMITNDGPPANTAKLRAAANANKRARQRAEHRLQEELETLLSNYELSSKSKESDTMAAFAKAFPDERFSHDIIRSLIEIGGKDLRDFGYKKLTGRNKAGANDFMARHYFD